MNRTRPLISLALAAAALSICQCHAVETRSIDDLPVLLGADVDAVNDFAVVRDASAGNPGGRKLHFNQLPKIPNFFNNANDGSIPWAKMAATGNGSVTNFSIGAGLGVGGLAEFNDNISVVGNVVLGTNSTNTIALNGRVTTALIPTGEPDFGSTGNRWGDGWFIGTVTAGGFSGPLTGNASTATTLATGRTIAMTGDVSWTSPSFNGSTNVTAAGTLATVMGSPGTFGNASLTPTITVDGKGRITNLVTNPIIAPAGTLSGTAVNSTVVTWNGNLTVVGQTKLAAGQTMSAAEDAASRATGDVRWFNPYAGVTGNQIHTKGSHWSSATIGIVPFLTGRPDQNVAVAAYGSSPPDVKFVPFFIRFATTINTARIQIASGTHATYVIRGALYSSDADGFPLTRVGSAWTWSAAATGDRNASTGGIAVTPGLYWVAIQAEHGQTTWGAACNILGYSSGSAGMLAQILGLHTTSGATGFNIYNSGAYPFAAGWSSMPSSISSAGGTSISTTNQIIPAVLLY